MLPGPHQVGEPEVHHLNPLPAAEVDHLRRIDQARFREMVANLFLHAVSSCLMISVFDVLQKQRQRPPKRRAPWPCTHLYVSPEYSREHPSGQGDLTSPAGSATMGGESSMPHYRYLIVGASMTADAAVHGIRDVDPAEPIGLIGAEPHPPYNRPTLSKGLWKDQSIEQIWRGTANLGADLHLGRRVIQLDKTRKLVVDDRGTGYTFDKLLLPTAGRPRPLPFDREGDRIPYFRSLDDYHRLRELGAAGRRFA